jgi:hypothetical protein
MTGHPNIKCEYIPESGIVTGLRLLGLGMTVGLWLGAQMAVGQEAGPSEVQVKAAIVANFPKYVDWPRECMTGINDPIVLVVLGDAALEDELCKMVSGKSVSGHPLMVKRDVQADAMGSCHLLFIGAAAQAEWPKIRENLREKSVLTVGDSDEFLKAGGVIRLVRRDHKIRLELDLPAARAAGLQISSKLLAVADVVKDKRN